MASLPKNDHELRRSLKKPLIAAVDYVMQKMWKENRDIIRKVVYDAGLPSEYERTDEFSNAWNYEWHSSPKTDAFVEYEFFYDWALLNINRKKAQHGSPEWLKNYQDVRPYLADIIYGGLSGNLFGDGYWCKARDAWSELLHQIGKRNLSNWFKEGCEQVGLEMAGRVNVALGAWDVQ